MACRATTEVTKDCAPAWAEEVLLVPAVPTDSENAAQRGFTLLEVMCAFAILSVTLVIVTGSFAANIEKAIYAIDQREMRELADTVFGKILFEQQKHRDGDSGSMAVMYGEWAHLPQDRADRYREYHYSLSKKEYVAAGAADPNSEAENLFGDPSDDDDEVSTAPKADEENKAGNILLVKFTMRVYRQDNPNENLIVLTRYLRPPDLVGGAGR